MDDDISRRFGELGVRPVTGVATGKPAGEARGPAARAAIALFTPGCAGWIPIVAHDLLQLDVTRLPFWLFSLIDLAGVAALFSILTTPVALLIPALLPRAGRSRVMVSMVLAALIGTLRFFPGWGPFIF